MNAAFVFSALLAVAGSQPFSRWEARSVDCRGDHCHLVGSDDRFYPCRTEPMPDAVQHGANRTACPLACEFASRLSVITKEPHNNRQCLKFYNYGKYRDDTNNDWYMWVTKPCIAMLTTWCQFDDVWPRA